MFTPNNTSTFPFNKKRFDETQFVKRTLRTLENPVQILNK